MIGEPTGSVVVPDFLEVAARTHPAKLALRFADEQWNFAELHQAVSASTRMLQPTLPGAGHSRFGILASNRPGFAFAVFAAARIGSAFVPLNWRLSAHELSWQIEEADVGCVIADAAHWDLARQAVAGRAVPLLPMEDIENAPASEALPPAPPIPLEREAAVLFTSGTSGRPKGARLSYGNFWFSAASSALLLGQQSEDIWLAVLPLFHIGGLSILYRGVIGATPVVLADRFAPAMARYEIEHGASLVSLVPAMLRRMLEDDQRGRWPATLRAVLLGGSATPMDLIAASLALGIPIAPTYGLTESASQATTLLPADVAAYVSSSGVPLPVTRLRIGDREQRLGPHEVGEIELQGPTLFRGYLGQPERNSSATWFATGDAGYLDERGFLFVVDRRSDLIITGGENVYPAEIERVLREHPRVIDAGVIGVPVAEWGARPVAAVVWRGDPTQASDDLRAHCRARLATFKIPDQFYLVPAIPRSGSGKLIRRRLRPLVAEAAGGFR